MARISEERPRIRRCHPSATFGAVIWLWLGLSQAQAATLKSHTESSGGSGSSTTSRTQLTLGEPTTGTLTSATVRVVLRWLAAANPLREAERYAMEPR